MDQKGLKVDSYCFIFYFYLIYQSESLLPWAYLREPLLLFFLFLSVPPTSPEVAFYTNWLSIFSLFIPCVVCLFLISVCAAHLSWACPELVFYNKWLYASLLFFYFLCCLFICILSLCPPVLSWSVSVTRCCGCSPLDELSPMLGYFRLTCTHMLR